MLLSEAVQSAILDAANHTYATLAVEGYNPQEVHKLQVCYKAADLMVGRLVAGGYAFEHEIRTAPGVTEHSYISSLGSNGNDIIADPTWQQFLPKDRVVADAPKVLFGTRDEVVTQARMFGVDEPTLELWGKGAKITPDQQRQANAEASTRARQAEADGLWEKFMANAR